jgi:hypothetical protein
MVFQLRNAVQCGTNGACVLLADELQVVIDGKNACVRSV